MALITVRPTKLDIAVAKAIAARTDVPLEKFCQVLTWGADEHVLLGLATTFWLFCHCRDSEEARVQSTHLFFITLASAALPHVLKRVFDQERPDRRVCGPRYGIPISGKKYDAFPSGHAVHIGALASAACMLRPKQRNTIWAIGAALAMTRIMLLAHWVSDVAVGLAVGVGLERSLRSRTGADRLVASANYACGNTTGQPRKCNVNDARQSYESR